MGKIRSKELFETRAVALFEKGSYRAAATIFRKLLANDECNAIARCYLGLCLYESGQFRRAIGCFMKCKRINPRLEYVYLNLGSAFEKLGKRRSAICNYRKALELNPLSKQSLYNLGNLYYELCKYSLAVSYLEKCYYTKHSVEDIVDRLAHCYFKTGQLQKEIALYEDWLQAQPNDIWSLNNLGAALMQKGEYNRAQLYLRKGARINPKDEIISRNFRKVQALRERLRAPATKACS